MPFVVAFVETVYTVDEGESEVNVCVNINQPDDDIFINETFNVFVIDDSNSVYIPTGSPLASELLPTASRLTLYINPWNLPAPDPPNDRSQYHAVENSDYEQQTDSVNRIDDTLIQAGMSAVCYSQVISNDARLELDEYAGLRLRYRRNKHSTTQIEVQPMFDQAAILIIDNDSKFKESIYAYAYSIHFPVAVVGVEHTSMSVLETDGIVELCVIVSSPDINCPISFPFEVRLSTSNATAGNLQHVSPSLSKIYSILQTKLRIIQKLT